MFAREGVVKPPCRIFLSYSHDDAGAKDDLLRHLRRMVEDSELRTATGLTMADVFWDEARLDGINGWSAEIECQIEVCEVFVYLISAYSFDPASYCRRYELPAMMRRRSPPLFVMIHLETLPRWDQQRIGDEPLPEGVALPKVGRFCPPERRGDPMPWDKVIEELHRHLLERCRHDRARNRQSVEGVSPWPQPRRGQDPVDARLLPYLCDQSRLSDSFADEIEDWHRRDNAWALVVLYKGHCDDGLRALGRRLRRFHLKRWFQQAPERHQIPWPVSGTRSDRVAIQVLGALCDLLELNGLDITRDTVADAVAAMVRRLQARDCPLHVVSYLPGGDWAGTATGVKELLQCFDRVEAASGKARWLVLDLILEVNDAVPPSTGLVKKCRPAKLRSAHLAELPAPEALGQSPVDDWFRTHFSEVDRRQQQVFREQIGYDALHERPLRMRVFAERVSRWLVP